MRGVDTEEERVACNQSVEGNLRSETVLGKSIGVVCFGNWGKYLNRAENGRHGRRPSERERVGDQEVVSKRKPILCGDPA